MNMGVRWIFGVLMIHIMITDTFSEEVPPEFIGLWRGELGEREVFTTIFGGKVNSIVGMSVNVDNGHQGRKLKFIIEGKKGKRESTVSNNVIVVEALPYTNTSRSSKGKFVYTITGDTMVVAETYFNDDGKVTGESLVALWRADDGFMAKTYKTCKPKGMPLTPKAKLQRKLRCRALNKKD